MADGSPPPDWCAHVDGDDAPAARTAVHLLDGAALAAPLPPLAYLVREIGMVAGSGAPHLLAGYGFVGKTIVAQALLLSLASGRTVWGGFAPSGLRRVLHVDCEQGERLTRRRYQRLAYGMGVDLAFLGDALAVAVMPPITLAPTHARAWGDLMTGRDVIVVDSLRAATPGADENASEIRAAIDMLGVASEATGCRAIIVHHARKPSADDPGGRYALRGSSAIFDACDGAYLCSAAKGEPIAVEMVKARSHGEPCEPLALVIEDVASAEDPKAGLRIAAYGQELLASQRAHRENAERTARVARDAVAARDAIAKHPGIGVRELRQLAGLSGDRLAMALASLGEAIEVCQIAQGRTRTTAHYIRGAR